MICLAAHLLPNGPAAQTVVPCEGALCVATLICLFLYPPFITDFLALKQDCCDALGQCVPFQERHVNLDSRKGSTESWVYRSVGVFVETSL